MSLDAFRQACIKSLTEAQSQCMEAACAMMPQSAKSADDYAMTQVDRLAFARAMTFARNAVNDQYRKMTEPESQDNVTELPKKQTGALY